MINATNDQIWDDWTPLLENSGLSANIQERIEWIHKFVWNESHSVGVQEIDEEHREIERRIYELWSMENDSAKIEDFFITAF